MGRQLLGVKLSQRLDPPPHSLKRKCVVLKRWFWQCQELKREMNEWVHICTCVLTRTHAVVFTFTTCSNSHRIPLLCTIVTLLLRTFIQWTSSMNFLVLLLLWQPQLLHQLNESLSDSLPWLRFRLSCGAGSSVMLRNVGCFSYEVMTLVCNVVVIWIRGDVRV